MSRAERTVKDTAKLYGSQLAAGAFAVIFSAWLVRSLPSAELSLWPVCFTLAAIVQVLSQFGMGDLFVRIVPSLLQADLATFLAKSQLAPTAKPIVDVRVIGAAVPSSLANGQFSQGRQLRLRLSFRPWLQGR